MLENVGIGLLNFDTKAQPRAIMSGLYTTAEEMALAKRSNDPWLNLTLATVCLERSYQKLASFCANGCFLAPPVTLAGFTSGVAAPLVFIVLFVWAHVTV